MRDQRKAHSYEPDPLQDIFGAAAFAAEVASPCLDTIGTKGALPAWLSLEAEKRRLTVAYLLRDNAQEAQTETAILQAQTLAKRIAQCSERLAVLEEKKTHAVKCLPLRCSSRWCPPCSISLTYSRAFHIIAAIGPMATAGTLTHAVFTTPNVPLKELRNTCRGMRKALALLTRHSPKRSRPYASAAGIRGAVANLEVTYNPQTDEYHPHIHAILDSDRLPQAELSHDWDHTRAIFGLSAKQSLVFLARIRRQKKAAASQRQNLTTTALEEAAFEVAKYVTKPADAFDGNGFRNHDLADVVASLRGLRVSDSQGTIREALRATDQAPDQPTHAWLGTLTQLIARHEKATVDAALVTIRASPILRRIHARHYGPAASSQGCRRPKS